MKQLLIALIFTAGFFGPTHAESPTPSRIAVENAWARATPGGATTGAVYLTLVNHGADADRLVGVETPVADRAQLHAESIDDGVMKMRPLAEAEVKPGVTTALRPGTTHVMLMGLKQPLKEGETFPLTLDFAKAGKQDVQVKVAKAGAMGMPGMGASGAHDTSHIDMMKH
jgi:periplasmic copper chaperone A